MPEREPLPRPLTPVEVAAARRAWWDHRVWKMHATFFVITAADRERADA